MFRDPVSFKDDVLATVVAQVIAHGQPGLAATDRRYGNFRWPLSLLAGSPTGKRAGQPARLLGKA